MLKRPREPELHDIDLSREAELLKLVPAVFESTRPTPTKRRVTLRQRLRRVAKTLREQFWKHPYLSSAALGGAVIMAIASGMGIVVLLNIEERVLSDGPASGRSGSSVSSSIPGSAGQTGAARVVDPKLGRRDIGRELIARVAGGDYRKRTDIATGRFLGDFENQWLLLVDVDHSQLRTVGRGKEWVRVRGPYDSSVSQYRSFLTERTKRGKTASEAIIRIVEEDDLWKLEHIRVY